MRSLPSSLLALLGLMLVGATATANPSPSPPATNSDAELICHTDNPAECYPKTFQPTDEFQIVRPDQDIPKGLHVRLNVQTGQKEAKINVPGEDNPALAGLPVDTSMVVVSPEDTDAEARPKIPRNAPVYDPDGKIKPSPQDDATQTNSFHQSLAILKKGLNIDEALEMLEDISHDIYYGLKITEDYDTVKNLFCLANTPPTSPTESSRAKLAALTISSAIQNNPKALSEIAKHWPSLTTTTCPGSSEPLGTSTFRLTSSSSSDQTPTIAKARISAIGGLIKEPVLREHFLSTGGMDLLLDVFVKDTEDWEPAQRKAAILVLDNFLDEDMGATLGEWPTASHVQAGDKDCAARTSVSGECWDWHVRQLADRHRKTDKGHWSVELWGKLKEQRKRNLSSGSGKKAAGVKEEL